MSEPVGSQPPLSPRSWKIVAGGVLACSLVLVWVAFHRGEHKGEREVRDLAIEAEWQPSDKPVLSIPGMLEVAYHDRGDKVELAVVSDSNPVLYVDLDGSHTVTAGDVSYAADPSNRVCVEKLVRPGSVVCETNSAGVTVRTETGLSMNKTTWVLPKRVLAAGRDTADIMIQRFNPDTQKGDFYPGATPFAKVYRLHFASEREDGRADGLRKDGAPLGIDGEMPQSKLNSGMPMPASSAVTPPLAINSFDVLPVSNDPDAGFRLRWKVYGARGVEIGPDVGSVPYEGERIVKPQATTRYVLTAKTGGSTVTRAVTIAVSPASAPRIAVFAADASEVSAGSQTRVSWDVEGKVSDLRIDPIGSGLPSQGSQNVLVNQTTDYTLTAQGSGGIATRKLTITAKSLGPPVVTLEAAPAAIHPGDPVVLHWTASAADRVSIDPGIGIQPVAGTFTVHPHSNAHYTLTATGRGGRTVRDVSISVTRAPGPARGRIVWSGFVRGTQTVLIDRDHADSGTLEGALPGEQCVLQLQTEKNVSIAEAPSPRNNYEHLVLRVKGNGFVRVVIDWAI